MSSGRSTTTSTTTSDSTSDAGSARRRRAARRSLRRHGIVAGASVAFVAVVMAVTEQSGETWGMPDHKKADGSLWQFNVATGSLALVLVVATLVYRPARIASGRSAGPAHFPWRRTIGVWAGIATLVHIPGGLAIHTTGWRFWTPFESVIPWVDGRRFDEFTIGYWMGALAVLALAPLLATSNDASIRRLGARRWQRLHRAWVWLAYWLVAVHVVALQYGEFRNLRHVAVTATVFAIALGARLLSRWRSRTRDMVRAPSPVEA